MSRNTTALRSLGLAAFLVLPGCATINARVDPWARQAGVTAGAPVILSGKVTSVKIYADGSNEPLKMVIVENPSFSMALGNAIRQSAAEAQAGHSPTGTATYTRNMQYAPAVYLMQKQTHRLRIVRDDGAEAIVVSKPHIGKGFLIVDWILVAPTFFTSIVVDAATGKWKVFDPIDVDAVFPRARGQDDAATAAPASPAATAPTTAPVAVPDASGPPAP